MRKLLWIGQPGFANSLPKYGWEAVAVHTQQVFKIFNWQELVALAGFEPHLLVVEAGQNSPCVLNPEDFPCLTVFYHNTTSVHTCQPVYAQALDACLVSAADYLPEFVGNFLPRERIWWSPPFATDKHVQERMQVRNGIVCLQA